MALWRVGRFQPLLRVYQTGADYLVPRDEIARSLVMVLQRARATGREMHLGTGTCFGHVLVDGGVV